MRVNALFGKGDGKVRSLTVSCNESRISSSRALPDLLQLMQGGGNPFANMGNLVMVHPSL